MTGPRSSWVNRSSIVPSRSCMPGMAIKVLTSAAPAMALASPKVDVLGDTTVGSVRTLRLRVTSARQPWKTSVRAHAPSGMSAVTVAGRRFDLAAQPVEQRTSWLLSYFALPEQGVELTIELARDEPVTLVVSDITHGLPVTTAAAGCYFAAVTSISISSFRKARCDTPSEYVSLTKLRTKRRSNLA
jgi:hypothetical protein